MFGLFESKGVKRTLASIFAFAATIAPTIPALAPYAETIQIIAGMLGGAGIAHAGLASLKK